MTTLKTSASLVALSLGMGLAASVAQAAVVDGILTGADSYDFSYDLGFAQNSSPVGATPESGKLMYSIDGTLGDAGSKIFVLFALPEDFVDNVFGNPADDPARDWLKGGGAGTGGHTFKDLIVSDNFVIDITSDLGTNTIELDLLDDESKKTKGPSSPDYVAQIESDPDGIVLDVATSLEYDMTLYTAAELIDIKSDISDVDSLNAPITSPIYNPLDPARIDANWETQVIYEFVLDGSAFSSFSLANLASPGAHASPAKQGAPEDFNPPCIDANNCDPTTPPGEVS